MGKVTHYVTSPAPLEYPVAVSQKMSVLRFTSLSSFLCPLDVFSNDQKSTLIKATRDRAVLLLEIHEFVFQHHMSFGSETVRHIKDLQAEISAQCPGEVQDEKKFTYELSKKGTFDERVVSSLPSCMHWLTWIATGSPVTAERVGEALNFVFEEQKHVQRLRQKNLRVHTFRDRCRSSGVPNLQVPVNQDKSSDTPLVSRPYMKPRDRIKSLRYTKLSDEEVRERCLAHWEYIGVLEAEVRIRLQLTSIPESWTCVRAALMSYGMYMNIQHPYSQHFPVSLRSFGSYCCMFDNAGTLSQYMAAVGKAHSIQGLSFVSAAEQSALKKGSRKFQPKSERSFVTHDQVTSLCLHASSRGRDDLSRFMSVSYLYQGRVQSEIVPLESVRRQRVPKPTEKWHSFVRLHPQAAEIVLRKRKNKPTMSVIYRECQCHLTPAICGVCALRAQLVLAKESGQARVFWTVSASDIKIIQQYAVELSLERPTWHGFRRGRTSDLVTCVHWGLNVTLSDIFESGGWAVGSRAVIKYLSEFAKDKERLVSAMAAGSDSE